MGTYTSLVVSARLKGSTPKSVIETINGLITGDVDVRNILGSDAHRSPLGGSSAYFPEPVRDLRKSGFTHTNKYSLTIVSNIKNYHGEIELFLKWLRPYVDSGHGMNEWWALVTHEEADAPTIYYLDQDEEDAP